MPQKFKWTGLFTGLICGTLALNFSAHAEELSPVWKIEAHYVKDKQGRLFAVEGKRLAQHDLQTGKTLWETEISWIAGDQPYNRPNLKGSLFDEEILLSGSGISAATAFTLVNKKTGAIIWTIETDEEIDFTSASSLHLCGNVRLEDSKFAGACYSKADGTKVWSQEGYLDIIPKDDASVLAIRESIAYTNAALGQNISSWDMKTGKLNFEISLKPDSGVDYDASKLYVLSEGEIKAYSKSDGTLLWSSKAPDAAESIYDEEIFLRVSTDTQIHFVDKNSGKILETLADQEILSRKSPSGDIMLSFRPYQASEMKWRFYRASGELLWEKSYEKARYPSFSSNGALYLSSYNDMVRVDEKTGEVLWTYTAGVSGYGAGQQMELGSAEFGDDIVWLTVGQYAQKYTTYGTLLAIRASDGAELGNFSTGYALGSITELDGTLLIDLVGSYGSDFEAIGAYTLPALR